MFSPYPPPIRPPLGKCCEHSCVPYPLPQKCNSLALHEPRGAESVRSGII